MPSWFKQRVRTCVWNGQNTFMFKSKRVDYHTPLKNHAFIISNEEDVANLIFDMHCKIINTHQRLKQNIDIFSEKWINKMTVLRYISNVSINLLMPIGYFSMGYTDESVLPLSIFFTVINNGQ